MSTVTTSPLERLVDEKFGALVPVFIPLTFHWYTGLLPPLIGVAVKLIGVPGQTAVAGEETIVTDGTTDGFTTTVKLIEITSAGAAQ
jgi:hypothetical protein